MKDQSSCQDKHICHWGTWLSCFESLIFIVLFKAGLQGVKYKLEQMA